MKCTPCLAVLLLAATPFAQEAARLPEPFLRLRVDDVQGLAGNRQYVALWKAMRSSFAEVADAEEWLGRVETLLGGLALPLELHVILASDQRVVAGLLLPPVAASLTEWLREIGPVEPDPKVTIGKNEFSSVRLDGARLLEGDHDGRRLVLLDSAGLDEPAALVAAFTAAVRSESPGTKRLRRNAAASPVSLLLNVQQLLAAVPAEARPVLGVVTTLFGARFAGFTVGMKATADRVESDVHLDLVPGQGTLATLLPGDDQPDRLGGWVPTDAKEFFHLRVAMEGVADLLRLANTFGLPLDPAEWGEGWEGLAGTDVIEFLEEHLNGEVLMLLAPTKAEDALDPEAEVPTVAMLGSPDGARLFAAFRGLLARWSDAFVVRAAEGLGEQVHEWVVGDEVLGRFVVQPHAFGFAGTDAESTALLRAMLATGGTAQPPTELQRRLGPAAPDVPVMLVGLQHVFSNVQGNQIMRDVMGRAPSRRVTRFGKELVSRLAKEFGGDVGLQALRVVADKDGLRLHHVW